MQNVKGYPANPKCDSAFRNISEPHYHLCHLHEVKVLNSFLSQSICPFYFANLTYKSSMSLSNALPADAARAAKSASHRLATLSASSRNDALTTIHSALIAAKDDILAANARDLVAAKQAATKGELSTSLVSRLDLGKKGKWEDMLKGILDVRGLEDPGKLLLCLHMLHGLALC